MKNKHYYLWMLLLVFLSACGQKQDISSYEQQIRDEDDRVYQDYSSDAFQKGEVPLNEWVKIKGKIIQTDNSDGRSVKKNDRFVLEYEGERYQVFNYTKSEWSLDEVVTVYGEYYGFIKADAIKQ